MSNFLEKKGLKDLKPENNNFNNAIVQNATVAQEDFDDETAAGCNSIVPLPFVNVNNGYYEWPRRLTELFMLAKTGPLQDAVFLTSLALLPFTIAPKLRIRYNGTDFFCAPMLLFSAPPAAGKGVIGEIFHLLDIEDKRRRDIYDKEFAAYEKRKNEITQMGRAKARVEIPKEPRLYMAKISADNTASGLLENISDCKGHAALVDTEMFNLAQSTDRKAFGDPTVNLCKAWSHEDLSMNRRTHKENVYVENPVLVSTMTGTPYQISFLVKSPENGYFSRVLYYHIPVEGEWQETMKDGTDIDNSEVSQSIRRSVLSFAEEWEALLHKKFDSVSDIRLVLTEKQIERYNDRFCKLNDRAAASNTYMLGYVRRLGPNLLRLCTSLALVRALEPESAALGLLKPRKGTNPDNIKDNICPLLDLYMTDDDFFEMLNMAETLYMHAGHALSLLKEGDTVSSQVVARDIFFDQMSNVFTMSYAKAYAKKINTTERTICNWVKDFVSNGKLKKLERGVYQKTFQA